MADVIEHVVDPHAFFKDLELILKPHALVYMSTPDADSFAAKTFKANWHYINKYHFSLFSRKTLNAIAGKYGFREASYKHAPRLKSVGFILQYYIDFVMKKTSWRVPEYCNRWIIPINLFDDMQLVFEKK